MGFEVSAQEIPDTSGFERSGRLKVLEFEEDAAVCCWCFELAFSGGEMMWARTNKVRCCIPTGGFG